MLSEQVMRMMISCYQFYYTDSEGDGVDRTASENDEVDCTVSEDDDVDRRGRYALILLYSYLQ